MRQFVDHVLAAAAILFGVTAVSFLLIVFFGPDPSYLLAGPHATPAQIVEIRQQLGLDQPFALRYLEYLRQLATFDLGHSLITGEAVSELLIRAVPVTMALTIPGFLIGNLLGVVLALHAARHRGRAVDRLIMAASSIGMSISFVVIILGVQVLFCTPYGLDWFPVRGWDVRDATGYLRHVAVPTLALVLVSLGYNTRFYRSVLVEEMNRDHVLALRGLGVAETTILWRSVIPNALIPMITRILFSIPLLVIGGSLLIESHFGIPGIGKITFDAITSGDQMVLKAVMGLTAVLFAIVTLAADRIYSGIDPRVRLP